MRDRARMKKKQTSEREYKPKKIQVKVENDQVVFKVSKSKKFFIEKDDLFRILDQHPATEALRTSDFKSGQLESKFPEEWFSDDFVAHFEAMAEKTGLQALSVSEMAVELSVSYEKLRKWVGDLESQKRRREIMKKLLAQNLLEKYREQYKPQPKKPKPEFNINKVKKKLDQGMSPREIDDDYKAKGKPGFLGWYNKNLRKINKAGRTRYRDLD